MTFVKAYTRQYEELVASITQGVSPLVDQATASALQGRLRVDDRNTYISVTPSSTWNGTAGTGFSVTPTDPTRTTAKPAMRLIVPPNQAFTDYLVVGVAAYANNNGVLDNCGLKDVTFRYEGGTAVVTTPSFYSFQDVNGKTVSYFGWWAVLLHNGTNGDARLYVEATPKDTTMQSRVIGPYLFLPSSALYDLELTVAPSQSVIAGSRYQSITDALTYCAAQGKHHPRITITEARTDYLLATIGSPFIYTTGKGYVTIDATVPVTIIGTATYADATPRTKYMGMRFKGANITIDMATAANITPESDGNPNWLDGVRVINSAGRGAIVYLGGPRPYGVAGGNPYYTECTIDGFPTAVNGASLVRGCTITNGWGDALTETRCAIGNRLDDHDPYLNWAKDVNACTVTYTGAGATATLELSGVNEAGSRTFTAKVDGASVGTFTTDRFYTVDNGRVSSVVNWINGLSGWSATLQDDTRRASVMSIVGGKGAGFTARNCKNVTLQLVTMFDIHGDVYQHLTTGSPLSENVILDGNVITNYCGQCFFISSSFQARDFMFVNNSFHGKPGPSGAGDYNVKANFYSQLGRTGAKSHVVFAHNSSTQGWLLRSEDGFTVDQYCLIGNNVHTGIAWTGTAMAGLKIDGNHLFTGATNPTYGTNTTIGGGETDLWQSAANGDFTPKGALLSNLKLPALARDFRGRRRARADVAGASV